MLGGSFLNWGGDIEGGRIDNQWIGAVDGTRRWWKREEREQGHRRFRFISTSGERGT